MIRCILNTKLRSYISKFVQLVVCQFQFIEADDGLQPVGTQGWGVWVNVVSGSRAVLLETLLPRVIVELVSILITWGYIHEQNVAGSWVQI